MLRQRAALLRTVGRTLARRRGHHARRVGRPPGRVRARVWSRPASTLVGSWPRWPPSTTRGWPGADRDRPGLRRSLDGPRSTRSVDARDRGRPAGGVDGRPPPRRARAHAGRACRRAPTPPRVSSVRSPSPCSWPPTSWPPSGWAPPRSCCSTTCSPSSTRSGPGPCWPACPRASDAHHGPAGTARGRGGPGLLDGRRRPRDGDRRRGMSPEPPHRRRLASPGRSTARSTPCPGGSVSTGPRGSAASSPGWPDIVGAAMAEHVRPVRIDAIGPGRDRGPPGVGDPGPPTGGHAPRPGRGPRRCGAAGAAGGPGPALIGPSRGSTISPGRYCGGYTGALESGEDPRVRGALRTTAAGRGTGSHLLEHCERARLWR